MPGRPGSSVRSVQPGRACACLRLEVRGWPGGARKHQYFTLYSEC